MATFFSLLIGHGARIVADGSCDGVHTLHTRYYKDRLAKKGCSCESGIENVPLA